MVVGALLVVSPAPVSAAPLADQPFTAYGSGTAIGVQALQLGSTQLAGVQAAFSGGSVASAGLGTPINNEFGQNVQPAGLSTKNSYGRGAGIEVGLATPIPQGVDLNQIILSGRSEASAPPPSFPAPKQIALNLNPLIYSSTLRGESAAIFDPAVCPIGRPLSYGLGMAENLQLLNSGTVGANGFTSPLLGTNISTGTNRSVNQSRTVTYMLANGDGTFGVVSETRQTVAPIAVGTTGITVEVAGEFGLKATATGKPGGAKVEYTGNPVLTVKSGPTTLVQLTLQQLLGQNGLSLPIPPLLTVTLGTPPRALGAASGAPRQDADGTVASGAVDAARVKLLSIPGVGALDVALGHMEAAVSVPAGGVKCQIPVSKVANPDPITVGNDFTFTISIPSDPGFYASLFNCDLIGIKATDTVETVSGNPRIQLLEASNGGTISGNTVTWNDLGNYVLGQPPIIVTIKARVPTSSGAGVFRDTVNVTANLGNCRGGATGEDIINGNSTITGKANLNGGAITGTFVLNGPTVSRGTLAATGGSSWPLLGGGVLLFGALNLRRLRRKVRAS